MAHIGMLPVSEACEFARYAEETGVHAISSIPPYYYPFGDGDILRYYEMVLKAISPKTALLLYNIPRFSRNSISVETVKRLCKYPNFGGLKDSGGDKEMVDELADATGKGSIPLLNSGVTLCDIDIGQALPPFCNNIPEKARGKLKNTVNSIISRLAEIN